MTDVHDTLTTCGPTERDIEDSGALPGSSGRCSRNPTFVPEAEVGSSRGGDGAVRAVHKGVSRTQPARRASMGARGGGDNSRDVTFTTTPTVTCNVTPGRLAQAVAIDESATVSTVNVPSLACDDTSMPDAHSLQLAISHADAMDASSKHAATTCTPSTFVSCDASARPQHVRTG